MGLIDPSVNKGDLATNRTANKPKRSAPSSGGLLGAVSSHIGLQSGATWVIRQFEKALGWRLDAAPTYLFYVEISGVIVALFTECSGLKGKRQVESVREGGVNDIVHHLPGPITFDNIVLKRGLSLSRQLYDWFMTGQYDFRVKKHNLSIIQGAPGHNLAANLVNLVPGVRGNIVGGGFGKIKHWDVDSAFPVKWQMSDLDTSKGTSAVIESLELVHHGVTLSWDALTPMNLFQSVASSAAAPLESLGRDAIKAEPPACKAITGLTLEGLTTVEVGGSISFTATVAPDDATSPVYAWKITHDTDSAGSPVDDEDGKNVIVNSTSASGQRSHNFGSGGTYTVKVTASNTCTDPGSEAELEVTVECEPITSVALSGPDTTTVGQAATFTATADPADATQVSYTWDILEGTDQKASRSGAANTLNYIFDTAATYTITVTAENACTDPGVEDTHDVIVS